MAELRTLVSSILGCMRSLFWTLVLLFLGIYLASAYFTQIVLDYRVATDDETGIEKEMLHHHFGSLGRSVLSLYEAMWSIS